MNCQKLRVLKLIANRKGSCFNTKRIIRGSLTLCCGTCLFYGNFISCNELEFYVKLNGVSFLLNCVTALVEDIRVRVRDRVRVREVCWEIRSKFTIFTIKLRTLKRRR